MVRLVINGVNGLDGGSSTGGNGTLPFGLGVAVTACASLLFSQPSPPILVTSVDDVMGIDAGHLCMGETGGVALRAEGGGMVVPVAAPNTAGAVPVGVDDTAFTLGTGKGIGGGVPADAVVTGVKVADVIVILVGVGGGPEKANTSDADEGTWGVGGTLAGDEATVGVEAGGNAGGGTSGGGNRDANTDDPAPTPTPAPRFD